MTRGCADRIDNVIDIILDAHVRSMVRICIPHSILGKNDFSHTPRLFFSRRGNCILSLLGALPRAAHRLRLLSGALTNFCLICRCVVTEKV